MTEPSNDEPTVDIEYVPFVVDETPYCCWEVELHKRNLEFLQGIAPGYYSYVAKTHAQHLEQGENELMAGMAIRITYAQALETFFALLGAFVQTPDCVYGWLLRYRNSDLNNLISKIVRHENVHTRLTIRPTFRGLCEAIHKQFINDSGEKQWIVDGFESLWRLFATDFLDEISNFEYNSMKHGLRAQLGGFALALGPSSALGESSELSSMQSFGGSKYGSSFHVLEKHSDKTNFRGRIQRVNWQPKNLINKIQLLECSIGNVTSYLRMINEDAPSDCKIQFPKTADVFESPWQTSPGAVSFNLDSTIPWEEVELLSKEEILSSYTSVDDAQTSNDQSSSKSKESNS